jgi:hypothetical protein
VFDPAKPASPLQTPLAPAPFAPLALPDPLLSPEAVTADLPLSPA